MDPEREDYADPPASPSVLMGRAWPAALFLALIVLVNCIAFTAELMFRD